MVPLKQSEIYHEAHEDLEENNFLIGLTFMSFMPFMVKTVNP